MLLTPKASSIATSSPPTSLSPIVASNDPAIYRVRLSDQKVEKVLGLGDVRRVVTPWNTWFGPTPQGDILFMRDTGSQEVYALDLDIP
jgi:hypothetical protein